MHTPLSPKTACQLHDFLSSTDRLKCCVSLKTVFNRPVKRTLHQTLGTTTIHARPVGVRWLSTLKQRLRSPSKPCGAWLGCKYLPSNAAPVFLGAGDSAEDMQRLALLQECLALFNGSHAFHNYTKRKLYRFAADLPLSHSDLHPPTPCSGAVHVCLRQNIDASRLTHLFLTCVEQGHGAQHAQPSERRMVAQNQRYSRKCRHVTGPLTKGQQWCQQSQLLPSPV